MRKPKYTNIEELMLELKYASIDHLRVESHIDIHINRRFDIFLWSPRQWDFSRLDLEDQLYQDWFSLWY